MRQPLSDWSIASTRAGLAAAPADLPELEWRPGRAPGTVASSLGAEPSADARDWWYRTTFRVPEGPARLTFEGLATLAEVWLNGASILVSRNMFRRWDVDVTLAQDNTVVMVFRSVEQALAARRPRPRWRTALVDNQNLRWIRTTLMGRIPGWTPPIPAIGPWRAITLASRPAVDGVDLRTHVDGATGWVHLRAQSQGLTAASLEVGGVAFPVTLAEDGALSADVALPDAPLWWPHTHGDPRLFEVRLVTSAGDHPLGRIGFRTVEMESARIVVNGRNTFCRGACWTADMLTLDGAPGSAEALLRQARDAGLNMVRVGGTTTWASDELLDACDALGILLWQDVPLANMDYPFADQDFRRDVEAEVAEQLARLRRHPCVAVYCGGSEIDQQAAMMGLSASERTIPFLTDVLPVLCDSHHGGVPYVPSTPYGGALPFHTGVGITHYYGVGAYRRPLTDVRRASVRFTSECLGFSNVPDARHLEAHGLAHLPPHHPAWKSGVPRDNGAGWDFEDIRDHYLHALFGVDPVALRGVDPPRYLAMSRVVTGELMLRTFAEWRRPASGCGGALVWFLRDLRPGAGWGVFDSDGRPKAALAYLRRAWARRAVLLTDEGLDGVDLHVHNESAAPLQAVVVIELWNGSTKTGEASAALALDPYSSTTLAGDAMLGRFHDLAQAYRFGPAKHEAVVAHLSDGSELLHTDVLFPGGHSLRSRDLSVLSVEVAMSGDAVAVTLRTTAVLQAVTIEAQGYTGDDDCFHLIPGRARVVRFTGGGGKAFKAHISALNLEGTLTARP